MSINHGSYRSGLLVIVRILDVIPSGSFVEGNSGDNVLRGLEGRDRLFGRDGNDDLDAGAGTGAFQFL
jgi:Ca2+-binding RTX toxin-like protein